MYLVVLGSLWVLPAAYKVGLWVEGGDEALAVAVEVVGHKVVVDFAGEAQDAVTGAVAARVHMGDDKNTCNNKYSRSSYCGIRPVLWHSLLLCLEVVKDKSLLIYVVETYMRVI